MYEFKVDQINNVELYPWVSDDGETIICLYDKENKKTLCVMQTKTFHYHDNPCIDYFLKKAKKKIAGVNL